MLRKLTSLLAVPPAANPALQRSLGDRLLEQIALLKAHAAHASGDGEVRPEFVWTALDCSGGFALMGEVMRFLVTAWLAVRIDALPRAGETYIVAAWPVERGERKHKSGTAIFATDGRVLAVGGALWIEPRS